MNVSFTQKPSAIITTFVAVVALFFGVAGSVSAQANPQINYQGKLTDSAGVAVPDGSYNMRFWLISSSTAATTSAEWTESLTGTDKVQVTNGLFSVMLGSTSALTSVNFNQTLYLGVEVGGTSTPAWDGEMSPRKILGTVPAAFVANRATTAGAASSSDNASALGGVASSSFLRSDEADTMAATSSGTLLSVIQNGAGAIARFFSGVTEVFTILSNGNVGVGTTTPSDRFTVAGDARVTGTSTLATTTISRLSLGTALSATNGGTGLNTVTQNQLLIGGAGNTWSQIATSSLGLGNGTFLGLSDTPSSYTANRLFFTNSGGTAVTDSSSLVFDGTNFGIGSTTPNATLTVRGTGANNPFIIASSTGDSLFSILANGNVGIGSTLPDTKLHVSAGGSIPTGGFLSGTQVSVQNSANASDISRFVIIGGNAGWSTVEFGDSDDADVGRIQYNHSSNTLRFSTNGIESDSDRVFIGSGGNFGLGSSTPYYRLAVAGTARVTGAVTFDSTLTVSGNTSLVNASTTALTIGGRLYDGVASAGTSGMVLQTNGSGVQWVATSSLGITGGASTLAALTDTNIAGPAIGELLSYDGTDWVNRATSTLAVALSDTTGTLSATRGGTGLASYSTGDLIYASGANTLANRTIGTIGQVLSVSGGVPTWTSTSTLGLGNGTFLGLSDTPSSYTANRLFFTNSGGTAVTDSANLTFDGSQLAVNGDVRSGYFTATSTTGTSTFAGRVGIGTTTPLARLALVGSAGQTNPLFTISSSTGTALLNVSADGSLDIGAGGIYYDATTRQTSIESLNLGAVNFADDAGAVSWVDMGVVSAATGTVMSYTAQLDANPLLTIYGESAGTGAVQNLRVAVGSTTPSARLTVVGANGTDNLFTFASTSGSSLLSLTHNGRLVFGTTTSADIFINGGATTTNQQYNANNVVIGNEAFRFASSTALAQNNIAVGYQALYGSSTALMSGDNNLALGYQSLKSNVTGTGNSALGVLALSANTSGSYNNALGVQALASNLTGSNNMAVGTNALYSNISGSTNVAIGEGSLFFNTSGASSTAIGSYAGTFNVSGNNNLFLGDESDSVLTNLSNAIAIGSHAKVGRSSSLVLGGTGAWSTDIVSGTSTPWAKLSLMNNYGSTTALFDIATTTSSAFATSSLFRVNHDGKVGIGSSTPSSLLTVAGTANVTGATVLGSTLSVTGNTSLTNASTTALTVSGRLYDGAASAGTSGMVLQTTGTGVQWAATSSLGLGNGTFLGLSDTPSSYTANRLFFTNSGGTAVTDSADLVFTGTNLGIGTSTPYATLSVVGKASTNPFTVASSTGAQLLTLTQAGALGLGTSTPFGAGLTIERTGVVGTSTAGIGQYLTFSNNVAAAQQFGNNTYIKTTNTATTTLVGQFLRIEDSVALGNTVRGFEVQSDLGTSTLGENTAISGYARTFGVRGVTSGDAGARYEPAGVYGETTGTTQGNAIRGYSSSITTAALLKLFQDSSTFTGTGLLMNFGNSGGSFSSTTASRFIDLKNAGTSLFTVGAYGMLTIGDTTTTNNAGLQIGYGGICVDNDGSCVASTTGRITAVSYTTANSDLAENYFTSEAVEPGEVVYLKGGLSVGRASRDEATKIIGVVSTAPGLTMGENDSSLEAGERAVPVGLSGRVPVKVSNENGEVKAGDELMLSSIPGVVMKASSTGYVVGRALEDFDSSRAYSDTYINQFGENIIVPDYTPIDRVSDPRIDDGCYYGGGRATGDEPCVPLMATSTEAQYDEADALMEAEAKADALDALKREVSDNETIHDGEIVQVGQVVMFIDLRYRYLDEAGLAMVAALTASTTNEGQVGSGTETVWQRLTALAERFVDGVLSVLTLKADRVETSQLCVDGVCVNAEDLRSLLNSNQTPSEPVVDEPAPEPVNTPEPEVLPQPPIETGTTTPDPDPTGTEPVGGEVVTVEETEPTPEPTPELTPEPTPEVTPEPEVQPAPESTSEPEPTSTE